MARRHQQLGDDTHEAREQLPIPKAFAFGMKSVETIMTEAATRLEREAPDERVQRLQTRSLARLRQLLAALNSQPPGEIPSNEGNETGPASSDGQQPSITLSLEELRLLHAMQVDLYERTVALEEQRQGRGALEEADKQELQRLATEQGELAELLMEAMPAEGAIDQLEPPAAPSRLDDDLDKALEKAGIPGFGADE